MLIIALAKQWKLWNVQDKFKFIGFPLKYSKLKIKNTFIEYFSALAKQWKWNDLWLKN